MESIREIYRIGRGPSSSHTMAPRKAGELFKARYPDAAGYRVTLFGSLASTGSTFETWFARKMVPSSSRPSTSV